MKEKAQVMTVEEVINITIHLLQQIKVPVGLTESIGLPLYRAVGNLRECAAALARDSRPQTGPGQEPQAPGQQPGQKTAQHAGKDAQDDT